MKYDILLIAETAGGIADPAMPELLGFGRLLASPGSLRVALIVPGYPAEGPGETIREKFGIDVIAVEHPGLRDRDPGILQRCTSLVCGMFRPEYIAFLHTITGSAVAPAAAAREGASCITGIEALSERDGEVTFRRSIHGGKIVLDMAPREKISFLTVMPGAFPPCREMNDAATTSRFTCLRPDLGTSGCGEWRVLMKGADSQKLNEAEVVVSAGRGIGARENIALIERIAALFKKSAIGASRPLCDMGWLPYSHQVGSTGTSVSPRLYLACGISGSPQHLAGMKNSGLIVSINRDPDAAITSVAHYIIIDDLIPFLTIFEEKCSESPRKEVR